MEASRSLWLSGLSIASLLLPLTASAEGRWTSYLRGVGEDFESRIWEDRNTDNVNGFVYIGGCRVAGTSKPTRAVLIDVARVRTGPDQLVKRGNTPAQVNRCSSETWAADGTTLK